MIWEKITLVGVGLLGGSLGLDIRRRGLARRVEGYVRRAASIAECASQDVVDLATCDLGEAVRGADLVILCTPLAQMRQLTEAMLPVLRPGAIVTDVGSVKESVVTELEEIIHRAGGYFVGSHPMAGAEKMGVKAAREGLFQNAVCVLTPTLRSSAEGVNAVEAFWQALGSRTLRMDPRTHDEIVSRTSHLPHVVASALADFVLDPRFPSEQNALCANGFKDTTRIASSSPEMWRDIALSNRMQIGESIDGMIANLQHFQEILEAEDGEAIYAFFARSKQRRDQWRPPGATPSVESK